MLHQSAIWLLEHTAIRISVGLILALALAGLAVITLVVWEGKTKKPVGVCEDCEKTAYFVCCQQRWCQKCWDHHLDEVVEVATREAMAQRAGR